MLEDKKQQAEGRERGGNIPSFRHEILARPPGDSSCRLNRWPTIAVKRFRLFYARGSTEYEQMPCDKLPPVVRRGMRRGLYTTVDPRRGTILAAYERNLMDWRKETCISFSSQLLQPCSMLRKKNVRIYELKSTHAGDTTYRTDTNRTAVSTD